MPLVPPGQESDQNPPWSRFDRHHHASAYAALVLQGTCEEAGDRGRFRAEPGDVLAHAAFDGHSDMIGGQGAVFINIAVEAPLGSWFGRVRDLDAIVRAHRRDSFEASALLCDQFHPVTPRLRDWPDMLAQALSRPGAPPIEQWADEHGLHPASVSRGFRLAYGVSPKRFRLERMASRAARLIRTSGDRLAEIATRSGFADQAHMSRSIADLFCATPAQLRRTS